MQVFPVEGDKTLHTLLNLAAAGKEAKVSIPQWYD